MHRKSFLCLILTVRLADYEKIERYWQLIEVMECVGEARGCIAWNVSVFTRQSGAVMSSSNTVQFLYHGISRQRTAPT